MRADLKVLNHLPSTQVNTKQAFLVGSIMGQHIEPTYIQFIVYE